MKLKTSMLTIVVALACRAPAAAPGDSSHLKTAADSTMEETGRLSLHDIGRIVLSISNDGWIGFTPVETQKWPDCITGEAIVHGSEFQAQSARQFLAQAYLWIGGVLNDDTLVTTVYCSDRDKETRPDQVAAGEWLAARSSLALTDSPYGSPVSEQDRLLAYSDTGAALSLYPDHLDYRWHKPLHLRMYQKSYAWSHRYAEDIVFFNLRIENIGSSVIKAAYIGLRATPICKYRWSSASGADESCGYLPQHPAAPCGIDTINTVWFADNDGDPLSGEWIDKPVYDETSQSDWASIRSAMGVRFLTPLNNWQQLAFNWWVDRFAPSVIDYGPMRADNYRNFHTGYIGTPSGDRNRYYQMSNGSVDFDQIYTGVIPQSSGWLLPSPELADTIALGGSPHILLSQGPFRLPPGGVYNFAFCIFGGENFHTDPNNLSNLPHNPRAYYDNLDFSDLATNAVWAQKIYDNPGVDTDGDGYYGEYRICILDSTFIDGQWQTLVADTEWVKGDGIPDWRAATPPPSPDFWVTPLHNGLHIRINGEVTEPAKDVLTRQVDFEGYHVYLARDSRKTSYALVAGCDLENWDIYLFDDLTEQWRIQEQPRSLVDLRCRFGAQPDPCADTTFHPDLFSDRRHYYPHPLYPESSYYFTPHGFNVTAIIDSSTGFRNSDPLFAPDNPAVPSLRSSPDNSAAFFADNAASSSVTPIRRVYPDYPDPRTLHPDSITEDMYTEDGYLKYYEYECELHDLLPSVPYWVSVTAFDFGSPESGVNPLESDLLANPQSAFPLHPYDQPLSGSEKVYVYPNPYRTDVGYRDQGYEGRGQDDRWDERVRAVWFANLPPKCTIHIFTLDGDRVRTLDHDMNPNDPMHTHRKWDLINRNFQKVETGLYYWVVEFPDGRTQIGKLALIR